MLLRQSCEDICEILANILRRTFWKLNFSENLGNASWSPWLDLGRHGAPLAHVSNLLGYNKKHRYSDREKHTNRQYSITFLIQFGVFCGSAKQSPSGAKSMSQRSREIALFDNYRNQSMPLLMLRCSILLGHSKTISGCGDEPPQASSINKIPYASARSTLT